MTEIDEKGEKYEIERYSYNRMLSQLGAFSYKYTQPES